MLEFKFKQVTLIFDFSFFAVVSLMLLFGDNKYVIMCVLACLWHESGHLIMMLLTDVRINRICLYGGGIRISPDKMFYFTTTGVQLKVLLDNNYDVAVRKNDNLLGCVSYTLAYRKKELRSDNNERSRKIKRQMKLKVVRLIEREWAE